MHKGKLQQTMEEKLASLEKRLAAVTRDITKTLSSDFAEQATERENDDVLEEIAKETQTSIARLKAAPAADWRITTTVSVPVVERTSPKRGSMPFPKPLFA